MCGIIGVIGSKFASEEIFMGLLNQQHRGQHSAGILTYQNHFHLKREVGLVDRIFQKKDLEALVGSVGIGHNRYRTAGTRNPTQPYFLTYPYGIGMVHNGNIINFKSLREYLIEEKHRILTEESDLDIILNIFCDALDPVLFSPEAVFNAVREVFRVVNGGYSAVGVIAGKGLLGFKDPRGIRPLILCEREHNGEKSYSFSSEDVAMQSLDYRVIRDLEPGEVVFIDMDMNIHSTILERNVPAPCMFEWVYFARAESVINEKSVYNVRLGLGKALAKLLKGVKADLVAPVPDTSRTAAISLAEELNLPYREVLIKNRYIARTFILDSQRERENAVKLKMNVVYSEIQGKDIIVVDDSIVRGTTSKKIIDLLRGAGARKIYFVSTCPPIKNACYYGIDFPLQDELIASNQEIEEIRKSIGADALYYLDVKNLKKVLGIPICTACLTGEYPTPLFGAHTFEQQRIEERR